MADHACAQVERDNIDLHRALAQAIRRINDLNDATLHRYPTDDLRAVLDRTSRPEAETEGAYRLLVVQLEPSTGRKLRHALMHTWAETLGVRGVTDLTIFSDVTLDDLIDLAISKRQEAPAA